MEMNIMVTYVALINLPSLFMNNSLCTLGKGDCSQISTCGDVDFAHLLSLGVNGP